MLPLPLNVTPKITRAIRFAVFGMSLAGLPGLALMPLPVLAQSLKAYQIPAGPLGSALTRFGVQAGVTISFDTEQTRRLSTAGLTGTYSIEEGLSRLLANSGLLAQRQGNGGFVLIAGNNESAVLLGTTSISGQSLDATTEGTGSYTTGSMSTATKLATSMRETPQSVTVITRQRMDDQNMQSLEDISTYTPGLTMRKTGGERPQFYSRGSAIDNIMIDGLPVAYDTDTLGTSTMAMFDRVEVVRGASGLMIGAGNPSGTLNLIRKRPTVEPQVSVTVGAGSWDNYRTELDASSALNSSGSIRGRVVGAFQDKDSFTDGYSSKRQLLYGITEFDLSEATTLTLGAYYNREDNPGADWSGIPTKANGTFLPISRSTRMSPKWTYWNKKNTSAFAELEHRFDNDWKLRLNTTWLRGDLDMLGTSFYRLDPAADQLNLNVGRYTYQHTQKSVDSYVSGPFILFGATHELVLGASYRTDNTDDGPGGGFLNDPNVVLDPSNFDYHGVDKPTINYNWSRKGQVDQYSTYATTRLHLRDDLKLILGSRLDWYEYEQNTISGEYTFGADYKATREYTPYAGLIYDINDTYSVYTSWTKIFQPQANVNYYGSLLPPVTGTNREVGIKGEYFEGALNASVAYFQLTQENRAQSLDTCLPGVASCSVASGEVQTKGVDMELQGMLARGWQASAGYTYAAAKNVKGGSGRFDSDTPYNLLKLSTTYQLPGDLEKWSIGGSLRSQSSTYTSFGVTQGGYSIFDLMTGYNVNKNLKVQANLNNVFDKRYYQSISNPAGANLFGDPRNVAVTMRWSM
ncbi:TonB-dependent receptor [Pseudomonas sp. WS 5021]|uniref:TonB-dependent siderophore receptor n=1 Tax=Pseudomonas sp. WS 5021 TaxID=2717490 RepID=UPI0021CCE66F|nr:TonB-dependent receptor [Pseudomonas sp. WS 5021]